MGLRLLAHEIDQLLDLKKGERLLFYGIGNLLRQDDGLGIRFIEELERVEPPEWVSLEANYQLNAEDSLIISEFDGVVFVDAFIEGKDTRDLPLEKVIQSDSVQKFGVFPFWLRPVIPEKELTFSTHAMSMGSVLTLCKKLTGKQPRTCLLALPGESWGIGEGLTQRAESNLTTALGAVTEYFRRA